MTPAEALDKIRAARQIHPNQGFNHQLRLYHEMKYIVDLDHPSYRTLEHTASMIPTSELLEDEDEDDDESAPHE